MLLRFPLPPYLTWVRKLWNLITIISNRWSNQITNWRIEWACLLACWLQLCSPIFGLYSAGEKVKGRVLVQYITRLLKILNMLQLIFKHYNYILYKQYFASWRLHNEYIIYQKLFCLPESVSWVAMFSNVLSPPDVTAILSWQIGCVVLCTRSVSGYLCALLWQVWETTAVYCRSKLRASCSTDQDTENVLVQT